MRTRVLSTAIQVISEKNVLNIYKVNDLLGDPIAEEGCKNYY